MRRKSVATKFLFCFFLTILLVAPGCGSGGGDSSNSNGNNNTGKYTANGTWSFNSGTNDLTLNWTSTDFPCNGPETGTEHQTVTITATQMSGWDNESLIWTRSSGETGNPAGTWKGTDNEGNQYTLSLYSNGTMSVSGTVNDCDNESEFKSLEFPFSNPSDIVRLASFGYPNWSGTEPHNGIDLIVDESLEYSQIISPTAGVVKAINTSGNSFAGGQLMLTVTIQVTEDWEICLVLEPGCDDDVTKAAQIAAVQVSVGQTVVAGTPIARLLVGPLGYSHLHYMPLHYIPGSSEPVCAYAYSSDTARHIFEEIAAKNMSGLPDGHICYGSP